jgi:hypothetical protein
VRAGCFRRVSTSPCSATSGRLATRRAWLAGARFRARVDVSKLQVTGERVYPSPDCPILHRIRLAAGQICRQGAMTGAP